MYNLADAIRKAWPILIEAARMGRTVTYTELAGRAGPPLNRRNLPRQLLVPLSARLRVLNLPDLSALVVRKDTGQPGAGWHGPFPAADPDAAWAAALADCFAHPWTARPDPRLLTDPLGPKSAKTPAIGADSGEPTGKRRRKTSD